MGNYEALQIAKTRILKTLNEFGIALDVSEELAESAAYFMPNEFKDEYFDLQMMLISKEIGVEAFSASIEAIVKQLRTRLITDGLKKRMKKGVA